MKKRRSVPGDEDSGHDGLVRELDTLRTELEQMRRKAETHEHLEAVAAALIGEFDPEAVLARAGRWATAALGRPCSVVRAPGAAGAIPLGDDPTVAWLVVDGAATDGDASAARAVAERIGRALDGARQVAAQAEGMRRLERSLLPDALLSVPRIQLASRYVPAHGTHDVGGDFYDAVRTGDSITLIVGDVQGKGIDAATLTSLARHTLRAGALMSGHPGELLQQLNRSLLYGQEEQLASGRDRLLRFVTAAVARLDPKADGSGEFVATVARAGQPPPLVVRSDGRFEAIEPKGVLLGVCADPVFQELTATLAVGDTLVLYTDGVIEQRAAAGKAMSEQQLGMLIRNRRGVVDAEAIAQLVEDTVHLVAPEDVRDDVAILVACVNRGVSSPSAGVAAPGDAAASAPPQ